MQLHAIHCGHFKLDGGAMYGVVPKSIWNKTHPADENNLCSLATRALLIEEGNRLILIDTGLGYKQSEKFFSHYHRFGATLDESLAAKGFHRDHITDVILTHLHFDHCGGAIILQNGKLVPAFKNATYWSNYPHWDWATNPNDREKASFLKENIEPLSASGQLQLITTAAAGKPVEALPTIAFSENIALRLASGHTESMMLPQINMNGKTVVYVADLFPCTGHIPVPYLPAYDSRPLLTMEEKKLLLAEAHANNYLFFFEHDPEVECCTLIDTEKGIRIGDSGKLTAFL